MALVSTILLVALPTAADAQLGSDPGISSSQLPRVFLDCQTRINCDSNHFRTEIRFVNWMRDRSDADVHVIFTREGAGGGGSRYTFDFVGRGSLAGIEDELTYMSRATDVRAETMDGLTQTLRLGLVRFAVQTGLGSELVVGFERDGFAEEFEGDGGEGGAPEDTEELYDPWDYWTFRFGLSGNLDIRETRKSSRMNPSLSANRTTADWKLNFSSWANLRTDRRQLSDGSWLSNDVNSWRLGALVVRSITPNMSVGIDGLANNSVPGNRRARVNMAPAVEYNYFPYEQANRRQMLAHYALGLEYTNYYEQTAFGVTRETLPQHRLGVQYRAREEWGNAGLSFESAQYLHDAGLYSFALGGDVSYRITRGLEVNLSGEAGWVNDNIHTPMEAIDDEDILLGRRALPSSYRYEGSLGFSYRWGSSFANIVNNRFPPSVR